MEFDTEELILVLTWNPRELLSITSFRQILVKKLNAEQLPIPVKQCMQLNDSLCLWLSQSLTGIAILSWLLDNFPDNFAKKNVKKTDNFTEI